MKRFEHKKISISFAIGFFILLWHMLIEESLQRTSKGPISVARAGSLVYWFCDEHLNTTPLSCRVRVYVSVRFAIYVQLLFWMSDVFFSCSQVLDVSFFVHSASDPCGLNMTKSTIHVPQVCRLDVWKKLMVFQHQLKEKTVSWNVNMQFCSFGRAWKFLVKISIKK